MRNVLFGLILLAGCTTTQPVARGAGNDLDPPKRLVLENASADAVRVFLEVGGRQVLLGRMTGFETTSLRIPAGTVHPGSGDARILIVPLGTPQPLFAGGNMVTGIRSDWYSAYDFLQTPWRYSGSQIVMVLTGRD